MKPLTRRILAGVTLTVALTTGGMLAAGTAMADDATTGTTSTTAPGDTAWSTPGDTAWTTPTGTTPGDTAWGTPTGSQPIVAYDTAW